MAVPKRLERRRQRAVKKIPANKGNDTEVARRIGRSHRSSDLLAVILYDDGERRA